MLIIGTGPATEAMMRSGGAAAAPVQAPSRIVINGDSITSGVPYQADNHEGFYSHTWADEHPELASFVTAQGSRVVGGAGYNGDLADNGANALAATVATDLSHDPDLLFAMIGYNDLASSGCQTATYLQRLRDWGAQIRGAGVKLAYSPPTPSELGTYVDQATLDYRMAKWSALWATHDIRNPAVWGAWADYYIPLGEHPFFRETVGFTSDGAHPTAPVDNPAKGQFHLKASFDAAMATLLDPARVNAGGPYESVWDAFGPFDDLAPGVPITRRVVLSGLAWAGRPEAVAVTGADAAVETNGTAGLAYSYNGDVVDLALTPSASHETGTAIQLTIGGERRALTYTTAANAQPAAYVHGGIVGAAEGGMTQTFDNLTFAEGLAVVVIRASDAAQSAPPQLDGQPMTLRRREAAQFTGGIELYDLPVTAGSAHSLTVTHPSWITNRVVSYGAVTNGAFLSATGNAPMYQGEPHLTPAVTVPANGLALAAFLEYGGASIAPATVNGGTTPIDEGHTTANGETHGIALARLDASGQASFNFPFGSYPRVIAVYGEA